MPSVQRKPWFDPTALVLTEAIKRSGIKNVTLADALKISGGTISNMKRAKASVSAAQARVLGNMLDIDPASIVSPGKPRKQIMGPAQQAMVMHEAREPVIQVVSKPVPVLGMEALSDGTTSVWCKVTLPADRGAALFRMLLDFDLSSGEK